jgi:hypothetical protein
MGTRAQVRFATREEGVTFSEHPEKIHAQFYVNSDGYPEFLGVEIANSLLDSTKVDSWEIEELCAKHGDLEYIYYVWQSKYKSTWISIFEIGGYSEPCDHCDRVMQYEDKCIFVGEPQKLLEKYD